ncbi:hypothetical protein D3C72_1648490 [compost metagenome]
MTIQNGELIKLAIVEFANPRGALFSFSMMIVNFRTLIFSKRGFLTSIFILESAGWVDHTDRNLRSAWALHKLTISFRIDGFLRDFIVRAVTAI